MTKGRESKPHIGVFGRRNNGKSSLVNCLAGQDVAIVSDRAGTTTDPVKKSFEITGFGPVILVDTAGIDDTGDLGRKRVERTLRSLDIIDLALLVITNNSWGKYEDNLVSRFQSNDIPFVVIHTKSDLSAPTPRFRKIVKENSGQDILEFSATDRRNYETLINTVKTTIPERSYNIPALLGDIIKPGDTVLLITPIDIEAPAGRIILPQVQAIRDILDNDAVAIVLKENGIEAFLEKTTIRPALAVTDSQAFAKVNASIPPDMPLTSFSIMLARFKGDFTSYLNGTPKISSLRDGDRVLLLESCSHHIACDDIGRMKIPRWLLNFTGKRIDFDVIAGLDALTRPVTEYSLVIQCGGCMVTRKQLQNRLNTAIKAGIPVTNYGMAIAYMHGIFERAIAPFTGKAGAPRDKA
jgi:[FeFe] hydrogenase H-cluster maturation GTPase HydF